MNFLKTYALYFKLGLIVLVLAGTFYSGWKFSADHQIAKQVTTERLIAQAGEAAANKAAETIAALKPVNRHNTQVIQHETRTETVYRDCANTPGGMSAINAALEGRRAEPAGSGVVPGTDTPAR